MKLNIINKIKENKLRELKEKLLYKCTDPSDQSNFEHYMNMINKITQEQEKMKELMPIFENKNEPQKKTLFGYRDSNGMLVQKDGDGGDSAYMTALAAGLLILDDDYYAADIIFESLLQCNQKPGIWSRYPKTPLDRWYENPNNFSRDQADTVDWCLSIFSIKLDSLSAQGLQKQMWRNRIKNWGFHQNIHIGTDVPEGSNGLKIPDITSLESIANLIRSKNWWMAYPILTVLDLTLLISLCLRYTSWDTDCMLARNMILSRIKFPTIFRYIAVKIYKLTNYKERIKNYFYKTGNSIEPLGDLYQKICKKYIDQ